MVTAVPDMAPIELLETVAPGRIGPEPRGPSWRFHTGETAGCGGCTRCLDDCPTQAFAGPYLLDARRCLAYLTIELRGVIPRDLRPAMGNWVFGCDVCQAVCPWNGRHARPDMVQAQDWFEPAPERAAPLLLDLLALDEARFRTTFRRSPVKRVGRGRLVRNACVAAGNWASPVAVPALLTCLHDPDPLVRAHAAWALGRIDSRAGRQGLRTARELETDGVVLDELALVS